MAFKDARRNPPFAVPVLPDGPVPKRGAYPVLIKEFQETNSSLANA
jgi:hypothetical protein